MTEPSELQVFEARIKTLLPEEYREWYEDVQPVSMGSAGLKFAPDGRVAWNEIWGSFCDLAMAGGPPHRGRLLEPASTSEIEAHPGRYQQVVDELCRGLEMVAGLFAEPSLTPGWIHIDCPSATMARWLAFAITMENVSAHVNGMTLYLPAGPHFRLEKEIKNVITAIAKTSHYWQGHTSVAQHRDIADLFDLMDSESPLIQLPLEPQAAQAAATLQAKIAAEIHASTGLHATDRTSPGWLGFHCGDARFAIRMMRALAVSNVLCRREEASIYLPLTFSADRILAVFTRAHRVMQG